MELWEILTRIWGIGLEGWEVIVKHEGAVIVRVDLGSRWRGDEDEGWHICTRAHLTPHTWAYRCRITLLNPRPAGRPWRMSLRPVMIIPIKRDYLHVHGERIISQRIQIIRNHSPQEGDHVCVAILRWRRSGCRMIHTGVSLSSTLINWFFFFFWKSIWFLVTILKVWI